MSYSEFVKTTFAYVQEPPPGPVLDICHCIFGLVSEYIELWNEDYKCLDDNIEEMDNEYPDFTPVRKEIGDMHYYKTMLQNILKDQNYLTPNMLYTIEDVENTTIEQVLEQITDIGKKLVFYKHQINFDDLFVLTLKIEHFLHELALEYGSTLKEIEQQNETKLRKRYSSGSFSPEEAARKADVNG